MSQPNGPAAYSVYDLLRTLVERVGWQSEEEKRAALASVDQLEQKQIFGNLATMIACEHPTRETDSRGRCVDCGRMIGPQISPLRYGSHNRYYG